MTPGGFGQRGLTTRVLILLSVALFPFAATSVFLTYDNARQAEQRSELALLLLTERATNDLQAVVQRGYGAARGLGQAILLSTRRSDGCDAELADFQSRFQVYSIISYIGLDGQVVCASNGERIDLADTPMMEALTESISDPRSSVTRNPSGQVTGLPVIVITEPVRDADGTLQGFLSLSVPEDTLLPTMDTLALDSPVTIVTFNHRGQILTGTKDDDTVRAALPAEASLADLTDRGAQVFVADDATGQRRTYGVVPLLPDVAFALSSWPEAALVTSGPQRLLATSILPALMWLASLFVAFVALDRLVIRHIRGLSRQMRTFARTRRLVARPVMRTAGHDLAAIEREFRDMAQSILQDEARLEDNLREKNILLKEVHHRVKNNLQLITSIMNMQMRKATDDEARSMLRRLQERVLTLASVHRVLYRSEDMNRIDAGQLIRDLAEQLVAMSTRSGEIRLRVETTPIELFPDQAVPLSMLCSEAMTNAIRYAGPDADGRTQIHLTLVRAGDGDGRLTITSTLGAAPVPDNESGLGAQLIRAFESQLAGTLRMGIEDDRYAVRLTFPVATQQAATQDY
ncbi:sensor histidine kinase [Jannaschia sp. KMU-145]|uniref:sensor histidine kinase n=1 Tax=Jannaschia halovivens TaxID=3388667 RepID=UPI00396B1456